MESGPEAQSRTAGGASGGRTAASWCSWMAVFIAWFERRGSAELSDDAGRRRDRDAVLGRFSAQETIWAAVGVLRPGLNAYGVPRALYTDWKNVYVRVPNAEERRTGAAPLTQFGRMCATLGIRIIPASSPQAKGRIERNHGTHQDRLVKKLRRRGIADVDTANAFPRDDVLAGSQPPVRPARRRRRRISTGRGRRGPVGSTRSFGSKTTRAVATDWVVRYHNRALQLERQSSHAPGAEHGAPSAKMPRGRSRFAIAGALMRWTEMVPCGACRRRPASAATRTGRRARASGPAGIPVGEHPWRKDIGRPDAAHLASVDQ